jgi:Tfp pilus assembly protein PilF
MNPACAPGAATSPAAQFEQVVLVCDHFESAWRGGVQPRIEDYLDGHPEIGRSTLLRELMALELELTRRAGQATTAADYRSRFPEETEVIAALFGDPGVRTRAGPRGPVRPHADRAPTAPTSILTSGQTPPGGALPPTSGPRIHDAEAETSPLPGATEGTDGLPSTLSVPSALSAPERTAGTPRDPVFRRLAAAGYSVLNELGRGGMGVVYQARQRELNRLVALKMIRAGSQAGPTQVARFRSEAEAIAHLHHSHIVQIHDIGEVDGQPYFALELLEGGSLADRLAGTPQEARWATELTITLARAIQSAHQAGIVHRDLKPANVLFDREGTPKISDFGLAKRLEIESGQTQTGEILGTPSYMAPEQAGGESKRIGPAADIYALGAILYEMLTGRPPFKGPTTMETVRQVLEEEPVLPSRLQPRVPRDLETIALKCLAKPLAKRYASAADLADDLERYRDGKPIRARRTPWWERSLKWTRRHPTAASLMALGFVIGVTAAVATWRYQAWQHERRHRDELRLEALRTQGGKALLVGQQALDQGKWDDARVVLSTTLERLKNEPALAPLARQARTLLAEADRDGAEQAKQERDHRRYVAFRDGRDRTLFHQIHFTGLDQELQEDAARQAAGAALQVFAAPAAREGAPDTWQLGPLPASLSEAERTTIRDGCYELLLFLAEATEEPADGLAFLERAAALRPEPTKAYFLRRAACLTRAGDRAGAEAALRSAEGCAPSSAFDYVLLAQERFARKEWAEALRNLDAAVRLQPDQFWPYALSAVCQLQLERPALAKAALNTCLQRSPELPWLYSLRGFASSQLAALTQRVAQGLAADRPERQNAEREMADEYQDAEADSARALKLLEDRPGDELIEVVLLNRGAMELQRGHLDAAESDLKAALERGANPMLARVGLAQVFQKQGRTAEALEQFGRAIALRPDWAPLYRGRADVICALRPAAPEQRAQAIADLEEAVRLETPGNAVVARDHVNRARLLVLEADPAAALAACERALAVAPDYPEAHDLRIRLLLDERRYADALRSCEALLQQGRRTSELYEFQSLARAGQGDFAGAIEDATKALAERPDSASLYAQRGWAYLLSNAAALALRDFDTVLSKDSTLADGYAGRGLARVRLGQAAAAVRDAEDALHRDRSSPRIVYNAARILAQASQAPAPEALSSPRRATPDPARLQDRAVALVREAVSKQPADRRASFWREILADPALTPVRDRLRPIARGDSLPQLSRSAN